MGNCMTVSMKNSSTVWGGDEWGSPLPSPTARAAAESYEEKPIMETKSGASIDPSTTRAEVKIKISKKHLEEILSKVDARGQSLKQILRQLISLSDIEMEARPRSWRPALHSISEDEDEVY